MSTPGGSFLLKPATPCTMNDAKPIISIAFFNPQVVVMAPGNAMNGQAATIPAVNAIPVIMNILPATNQAAANGAPSPNANNSNTGGGMSAGMVSIKGGNVFNF